MIDIKNTNNPSLLHLVKELYIENSIEIDLCISDRYMHILFSLNKCVGSD
jgi:hypothetical protein